MKTKNSDFDTFKIVSESSSFQSILKWSFFFVELWGEKMADNFGFLVKSDNVKCRNNTTLGCFKFC